MTDYFTLFGDPALYNKAIAKNKCTQMAQDFCSSARRKNGRIASYATIFTTQETDKKTSQVGMFFAGNRLTIANPVKIMTCVPT
ncbi:MAG: hypothetical protein EPN17_17945 [Methylobacter sp.]|nr:MAG: hypothetical protein EPN17_17945 [Methylobacter sp.]